MHVEYGTSTCRLQPMQLSFFKDKQTKHQVCVSTLNIQKIHLQLQFPVFLSLFSPMFSSIRSFSNSHPPANTSLSHNSYQPRRVKTSMCFLLDTSTDRIFLICCSFSITGQRNTLGEKC